VLLNESVKNGDAVVELAKRKARWLLNLVPMIFINVGIDTVSRNLQPLIRLLMSSDILYRNNTADGY
jgi:hypothetical protein